jgi:hypothetical protein
MNARKDSLGGRTARALNGEALLAAVRWVVDARIFDELKLHCNTTWKPVDLILLTVVWAWSEASTLTGAFDEAHRWSQQMLSRAAVSTYQGLMGALVGSTGRLLPLLWQRLQALMEKHGGDHWRIGCWLPLAVDGSRIDAPRTRANERAFCAANFGGSRMADCRRRISRRQGRPERRRRRQPLAAQAKPQVGTWGCERHGVGRAALRRRASAITSVRCSVRKNSRKTRCFAVTRASRAMSCGRRPSTAAIRF